MPDGLTQLGAYAFSDCENLRDVNIPRGISTIPQFAFKGTGLDRITIPGTVNTIESWAFVFCESLRHLTIENGVKRIEGAFPAHLSLWLRSPKVCNGLVQALFLVNPSIP